MTDKKTEALAEQAAQQQEPVAWRSWNDHDGYGFWETKQEAEPWCAPDFFAEPIYTSPPASKPWVGLDQHDIDALFINEDGVRFARYIEAKLKEKNA